MRILVAALLVSSGCAPSFAPPIRGLHSGMPGRLGAGQLEVGGTVGGLTVPSVGSPHVGFGIREGLSIQAGANLAVLEEAGPNWATGWAGVLLTRTLKRSGALRLIGDIELGAGGGVGGRIGNDEWTSLTALGIYEGLGLGLQWKWFGVYVRGRLDATGGDRLPTTLWPTLMLGVEARPLRWLSFGVGGGYAGYWNKNDRLVSLWFYQAQLALIFDVLSAG